MKLFKKSVSILLTIALLFGIAQPALAVMTDNPTAGKDIVIKDANGNVIEEDWETAFPYGTFVLAQSEITAAEGEKEQRITVYRLGGTTGRATAYFQIAPAVTQLEDDTMSYANAAGKSDYTLKVEDPLPIAQYQPIGRPADPLASGEQVQIDEQNLTENTYDDEGNVLTYGDIPLFVDVEADSYQWYAYSSETGTWKEIENATDSTLLIDQSMVEGFNYRCVYTVNGAKFSTDGLSGYQYEPYTEDLEPMPENLELNPSQTFSTVLMEDGEFDAYTFPLTFAEGEWKKEIIIQATDDDQAEADELAALTITGCEGGSVYDTANTLAIHIADNELAGAAFVSFAKVDYEADKSDLTATLTLTRTGDLLQFLEVEYKTVDGSAVSGVDYAGVTDGKIYFPSGVESVEIKIDLINDKLEALEPNMEFQVVLTKLLGGGKGSALAGDTEATVRLFNSNTAVETNAATMLSTQEADDLSQAVGDTGNALTAPSTVPNVEPAEEKNTDVLEGTVNFSEAYTASEGIEPLTHNYGTIRLSRSSVPNYTSSYWQDWAWLANKNNRYSSYDVNNVEGYMTQTDNWSGDVKRTGNGWEVTSDGKASGYFSETDFTERFQLFRSYVTFDVNLVSGWSVKNGASSPYIQMETWGSGSSTQRTKAVTDFGTRGFLGLERYVNYYTSTYPSWNVNGTNGGKIVLGIGREGSSDWDAHGRTTLEDAVISRRVLSNNLSLIIHTADDDTIAASSVKDKLFDAIKPTVNLIPGESGVNGNGRVYVGSQLEVKPAVSASYELATASNGALGQSIYLASGSNAKVNDALSKATVSSGNGKLTIKTDSTSNNLDVNGNYSINVVLDRVQEIEVDLSPSIPKLVVDGAVTSEIDPNQVADVVSGFQYSDKDKTQKRVIQYKYASFNPSVAGNYEIKSGEISNLEQDNALLKLSSIKNLKSINFNLPADCVIVFNGNSYAGNEEITIPVGRYTSGKLNFLYYTPDFITAENDMVLSISHIERYIDANGNGKLDGYYDASTGTFQLEKVGNVSDILMEIVDPRDYAITEFEPVYMDIDGSGNTQYVEQFFKVYYSMTPRSLVTPAGENEKAPAQILPVFTTNITNEATKSQLTEELQGYRFITSGQYSTSHYIVKNSEGWQTSLTDPGNATVSKIAGAYSGDGKLMYTAAANMLETVDTPLGGNKNPISFAWDDAKNQPKLDENGEPYYDLADWNPEYVNNLLYSFTDPAPIFINNTPLGDFIPVADVDESAPQGYNVAQLNNYLGSLNANDKLIVGVRKQTETTEEIKALKAQALSALEAGEPTVNGVVIDLDTSNSTGAGTVPGSDNLRQMSAQDSDENTSSGANSGDSENSMSEMNVDMSVELPTLSFGLSDYVTIIMDGYEVGFSIGVPLFKAETKTQAYTAEMDKTDEARKYKSEKSGPITQNAEAMSNIKKAFADPKSLIQDEAWNDIKETQGVADKDKEKTIRAGGAELSISFNVTILFKYNQLDNKFKFSQAMFAFNLGVQYKFTARLTVCPILYAYFIIGLEVQVAGGVLVDRIVDLYPEDTHTLNFNNSSPASTERQGTWKVDTSDTSAYKGDKLVGQKGSTITVPVKSDTVQITFSGKLGVKNAEGFSNFEGGYITSDGGEPVVVKLNSSIKGTGSGKLELIALEDNTSIDKLEQIKSVRNDTYFSGVMLNPSLFLEVGVGIGVEVLKAELYFKASIGCAMSFATRVKDEKTNQYKTEPFSFDSMEFRAGIGVRVVLLLFSFELDAIQFGIDFRKEYTKENISQTGETSPKGFNDSGWKFSWYAANGMVEFSTDTATGDGFPGVKIFVPANTYYAQQIFGPEDGNSILNQIEEYAYDPTDPNAPFQISGYSSSGDAFKLSENLVTGTDYKLVTVGQDNYLLYTIARELAPGDSTVDSNMLVMSQIVNTSTLENGEVKNKVGLYKPGTNEAGYIIVDPDDTGDLDFSAWTEGNKVYTAWVSYASKYPAVPEVGEEPTVVKPEGMTEENYNDASASFVVQPRPTVPKKPDEVTEPVSSSYWIEKTAYDALASDEEKAKYTKDDTVDEYYNNTSFTSLQDAKDALAQAEEAYSTYQKALQKWQEADAAATKWDTEKKAAYEAYIAWKNYFTALENYNNYLQMQLSNAAKNTIVKTASCDVSAQTPTFTVPETVGKDDTSMVGYMFTPQVADGGKVIFYASSVEMTQEQREKANQRHQNDYDAATKGTVIEREGEYSTATSGDPSAPFRLAYNQSMDDVYGQNTLFNFAVADETGVYHNYGYTPSRWAENGMRLENVAMTKANDSTYYLAYTASKSDTVAGKTAIVRFLYLQPLTITDPAKGEIKLGTAVVLRKLYDAGENADAADFGLTVLTETDGQYYKGMDGVYSGTNQTTAFEDPYFSNVRFLYGKLGALSGDPEKFEEELSFNTIQPLAVSDETFLLFEMNGNTYVVPQKSLETITDPNQRTGSVIPFFTDTDTKGTRGNMTIGTDADGNISAVYTDTVPNTTNNAIYVMKYDPGDGDKIKPSWGEGRMLAMNCMQVYEDSVSQGWSADELEAAYVNPELGGNMTSFVFSNLDIALGYKAVLQNTLSEQAVTVLNTDAEGNTNIEKTSTVSQEIGQLEQQGNENVQPSTDSTLLIITQGTQTKLTTEQYADPNENTQLIVPKTKEDGSIDSSTGFYAISFGVGEQNIGEGRITFYENDFTPGARLVPTISFKNTGDVPIRGSESNPIRVTLCLSGPNGDAAGGQELASWNVTGSIPVGTTISTYSETKSVYTKALPENLEGRKFYFKVSEDADYIGSDAYTYDSLTAKGGTSVKIQKLPELAVEDVVMKTAGVEGDNVVIDLNLLATNRGAANAQGTYLQFSYQDGVDSNGDPTYKPIDLRGHNLVVSEQKALEALSADAGGLEAGILPLRDASGQDNLDQNFGREVSGSFKMSKDSYCDATITGSLNIKIEIFYQDGIAQQTLEASGLTRSNHEGELNSGNNSIYKQLEAETFFTAPAKISVAVGTSTRLYIPAVTTRASAPVITVNELSTTLDEAETKHLGILYYNADGGYLVVTPSNEGEGVIRMADTETNSFIDIAFRATAAGEGINIFNDNDIFTFYDTAGNPYTADTVGSHKDDWKFNKQQLSWGDGATPYLYDLAVAKKGARFTLSTMADTLTLFFEGDITVDSNYPGFAAKNLNYLNSTESIKNGVTIDFDNNDNTPHTVTITVRSDAATFDKYSETYGTSGPPTPSDDTNAPQIYWSRNMPATASVAQDGEVTMTVYVIDDSGLNWVTLNGQNVKELGNGYLETNSKFWQFEVKADSNTDFTVSASDTAGNVTTRPIKVDWFKVTEGETTDQTLTLDAKFVKKDGSSLTGSGFINEAIYLEFAKEEPGETVTLYQWDAELVSFENTNQTSVNNRFPISSNGLYRIVKSTENGIFQSAILLMNRIDSARPVIELKETAEDYFRYQVSKRDEQGIPIPNGTDGVAPIQYVKVNGYEVDIPSNAIILIQNFGVSFNGEYLLTTADQAGNTVLTPFSVVIGQCKVDLSGEGAVKSVDSWNQDRNNGTVTVDTTKITGGHFNPELQAANNTYTGSYVMALVKRGETPADTDWTENPLTNTTHTFTGIAPGEYDLYVKDALETIIEGQEPNQAVMPITIGDDAITFLTDAFGSESRYKRAKLEVAAQSGISGDYLFAIYPIDEELHPDLNDLSWFDHTTMIGEPTYHDEEVTVKVPNPNYVDEQTTPDEKPYMDKIQKVEVIDTNVGVWMPKDDKGSLYAVCTFDKIDTGNYIVVVRDANDEIYKAYTASTAVGVAKVPLLDMGETVSYMEEEDGAVRITLTEEHKVLTEKERDRAIWRNNFKDIIIEGLGIYCLIPQRTLQNGDDVNDLFRNLTGKTAADGDVVICTDAEGKNHLIVYSYVGDRIYYIASMAGVYNLIFNSKEFSDLRDDWAKESIDFITARELFSGVGEGRFAPDTPMTRAMFVSVLHRLAGSPEVNLDQAVEFTDVPEDTWYSSAVAWASANGIVSGYGDGTFGPEDKISREQMCVIFALYMKYARIELGQSEEVIPFIDEKEIGGYAREAVTLCQGTGLISGVGNNAFNPKGTANRDQVAAIFSRLIHKVLESKIK